MNQLPTRLLAPVLRFEKQNGVDHQTRDPAAADGWKQVAISIKQSCEVTGLESGVKYWFRVAATNTQGQGPWSNPVCVRVK